MKAVNIKDLYDADYSVIVINALKQYWKSSKRFNCIGAPKRYNILVYLDGCKAVYRLKSGEEIFAESGSIVYTPVESEYSLELYDFEDESSNTIHINFLLYDSENRPFNLGKDIQVISADNYNYKAIFNKIDNYSEATVQCHGKIKSIMYDLLFKLSDLYRRDYSNKYSIIAKGITYLEQNEERNEEQKLSIADIANMCHVSEVYFRKLFKEYSGMSPTDFRTNAKICLAKKFLGQEELTIAEISDILGFSDVSYFIKIFKKHTGITPKKYCKALKETER